MYLLLGSEKYCVRAILCKIISPQALLPEEKLRVMPGPLEPKTVLQAVENGLDLFDTS